MADYYEPILLDGHHLALSRKNDGAFSGNSFDDSGALGRPDWRRVDRAESGSRDDAAAPYGCPGSVPYPGITLSDEGA